MSLQGGSYMRGKEKCKALKEIRRQIAEKNDIPFIVSECRHKGDCRGTCPKCESELRYLERELAIRQGLGKAVTIAGISVGVCTGLSACAPTDYPSGSDSYMSEPLVPETTTSQLSGAVELAGDLPVPEETETPDTIVIPDEVEGIMVEPTETESEEEPDWMIMGDIDIAE